MSVRKDIARVYTEKVDYLPGTIARRKDRQARKSVTRTTSPNTASCTPEALPFFQTFTHDLFCVGIEAVPAYGVFRSGR